MPLDPVNFHPLGPVKSADMLQFYQVLTGVMADQPVTFRNALTVGGDQSVTTIPLRVYGAPGQNTNLVDLYPDRTSAQPGFGFGAAGQFAWGPGGSSPQDTFLSRIGTQNGHAADTAGLLVTPRLEIDGTFALDGDLELRTDGATIFGNFTGFPETARVSFQTTVDNGATFVSALPDGTSKQGGFFAYNTADPTNSQYIAIGTSGTSVDLLAGKTGTAPLLPMKVLMGDQEALRLNTNGWLESLIGSRFSGPQPPIPPVGAGVEIFCFPPGTAGMEAQGRGYIQSYNRAASTWVDLYISGKTIQLNPEATVAVAGVLNASYLNAGVSLGVNSLPPAISNNSFNQGQLQLTSNTNPPQIGFHFAGVIGVSLYLNGDGFFHTRSNSNIDYGLVTDGGVQTLQNKTVLLPKMGPSANSLDITNNMFVYAAGATYLPAPPSYAGQQRWIKAWGGTLTIHVNVGYGLYGPGETGPNRADAPSGDGAGVVVLNGNSVHFWCDGGNWWVI